MDQVRAWFGSYEHDIEKVRRFWDGEGRILVSLEPSQHEYRQSFDDDLLLTEAPLSLEAQAQLPGLNLPSLYPDWGTISTAKYWGGQPRFDSTGGNIFVDPVARTVDEAMALTPSPADDEGLDGAHAVRLWQSLCADLETDVLWLRSPDMQGPLNTAGLVLNQEEMWMAMYTEPEKVRAFLDRVTTFLIEYATYLREATAGRICGNIWPYTFLPCDLGISLTEDMMPLMSPKLYREFGIPTLLRIQEALGSLLIHCCGDWGRHAPNLKASGLDIRAVEFHCPFTTIQELACLSDDCVFIPYIMLEQQDTFQTVHEYYRYLLATTPASYRYWFALTDDSAESRRFAGDVLAETLDGT